MWRKPGIYQRLAARAGPQRAGFTRNYPLAWAWTSVHRLRPHTRGSPVAAVTELKKLNLARVFNDYDFGGYLISNGVAPSSTAAPNSTAKNSSSTTTPPAA